jgi:hypothetical protein
VKGAGVNGNGLKKFKRRQHDGMDMDMDGRIRLVLDLPVDFSSHKNN